ncbi:Uncharacterised protein [Bordetella pertussis]|nr:Uncharacterised protein [Bordetella pertussis]
MVLSQPQRAAISARYSLLHSGCGVDQVMRISSMVSARSGIRMVELPG